MDAQQFLAEFGHIANAPGGVARLRELVLSLAVSGRLFEDFVDSQNSLDSYLASIGAELSAYKVAHKYRRKVGDDQFARQREREDGPSGIAIRLGQIGVLIRGVSYDKAVSRSSLSEGLVGLLRANNISSNVSFDDQVFVPSDLVGEEQFLQPGDILIAMSSGSKDLVGKAALVTETHGCTFGAFCGVFRSMPSVRSDFIRLVMQAPSYRSSVAAQGKGIGIHNLTKGHIENFEFILPSPHQQARIVSKVNELIALCDRLEKQQQDRRKLQNALRQATLQALAGAESPYGLQESWHRLQGNFGRLFSEPGDARSLRDVLFDLALRGLLLPDSRLSAGGAPSNEELGSLPSGWNWKTLAELTEYITSGSRGWKAYMSSSGDSFIRSQDIRQDALVFESPAYVTLPERVEGKRTLVRPGDLLLTITGGNVGRCAIVPALTNKAYVSQHVALIRLQDPSLSEFIHFWMVNAFGGRAFLARYTYGDKPGLNLAQVGSVPIPVPPASALTEVLKSLRRYQQLCDALESQLKAVQEVASKLSSAAVAALTGVAVEKEKEVALKAPQTELIAPLRLGTLPDVKDLAPLATLLARNQGEISARDLWQRFGGEIDAFYAQLKTEVAHGWIEDPSYELGEKEPQGPRTYPDGALVAKTKIKQEA